MESTPQSRLAECVKWVFFSEENMAENLGITLDELSQYLSPELNLMIQDPKILDKLVEKKIFIEYYKYGTGPIADLSSDFGNIGELYTLSNIPEGNYIRLPITNVN